MKRLSYLLTYRESNDPLRRENLIALLTWLKGYTLDSVILVEQDAVPSNLNLPEIAQHQSLQQVFAYNPGPFNKSWGLNVAARLAKTDILVFGDVDILCSRFDDAAQYCSADTPVIRPADSFIDLDEADSVALRADLSLLQNPLFRAAERKARQGETIPLCGGMVILHNSALVKLGGWDERFLGWGGEDDALSVKIQKTGLRIAQVERSRAFHLHHVRTNGDVAHSPDYRNNLRLLDQLKSLPDIAFKQYCDVSWQLAGHPERYRPQEEVA